MQKKKNATLDELVPAAYLLCFGWADFRSLHFGWRLGSSGVDLVVVSSKSLEDVTTLVLDREVCWKMEHR